MVSESELAERFVVGIDDTDAEGAPDTSVLARDLVRQFVDEGLGEHRGVTRHQLTDSPKVKRTTQNHAFALELLSDQSLNDVEDWLVRFVRQHAHRRADPAVAILSRHSDMPHVLAFGRRSQTEVMKLDDASTFSSESNVRLRALGGKRAGSIGALAAAGLRAGGGDGLFVYLDGLRELTGQVTAGQMRERCPGLTRILNEENGEPMDRDDLIETFDWVRPRMFEGGPLVYARRSPDNWKLWLLVDRRLADEEDA
ncbi:MAG: hypothetical protein IT299_04885 [Dehalococcoidia bacterium]|nr:hypothetical protein [Dehalococcoidia bacterium]